MLQRLPSLVGVGAAQASGELHAVREPTDLPTALACTLAVLIARIALLRAARLGLALSAFGLARTRSVSSGE